MYNTLAPGFDWQGGKNEILTGLRGCQLEEDDLYWLPDFSD